MQAAITKKQAQRKMLENFMDVLRGLREQVDYFDEGAWYAMVDFVTVYSREDVRFTFKNGMEVPVKTNFEDEHYYLCHDGRELRHIRTETKEQDGYTQTWEVYGCADCSGCGHKARCRQ